MVDKLDLIFTRRSIRNFTDEEVTKKQELLLLKAAMCAPNTVNNRSWAFLVIRERKVLESLSDGLKPNAMPLKKAEFAIVVCGDMTLTRKGIEEFWVQDCANASLSILLAANGLGLGGVWFGVYPQVYKVNNVKAILGLPEHIIPLSVLAIGYPTQKQENLCEQRYEKEKIHYEKWGGTEKRIFVEE